MSSLTTIQDRELREVVGGFFDMLYELGLDEVVGGRDVLDEGLQHLSRGLLPLAAELVVLEDQGRDLADAVNDPANAPYVSKVHGALEDILTQEVPAELLEWAMKLARMVPPPQVGELRKAIVVLAVQNNNQMARAVGRFFVFEAICMWQRFELLASGVRLEALGGRSRDVEVVAEQEVEVAEADHALAAELLQLEDPLTLLQRFGGLVLGDHVRVLKEELTTLTDELREVIERRRQILAVADEFPPDEALLILNRTAAEFGEERVSVEQLRQRHPEHLGHLSDAAIWKRNERLPGKVQALLSGEGAARPRRQSFGELLLEAASEMNR